MENSYKEYSNILNMLTYCYKLISHLLQNCNYYRERTKNELAMCRLTISTFEKEMSSLKRQLNDVKFEKAKLEQVRR